MTGPHQNNVAAFPTTHWSLVRCAGDRQTVAGEALGELLTQYLPALRSHLVKTKRLDEHKADDLLQGFVSAKFLQQNLASQAEQSRGKFRTFVLTALDNFVISEIRRAQAAKRLADRASPLADDGLEHKQLNEPHGSDVLDVEWARQVLREAVRRTEAECRASGRLDLWGVLECRVLKPTLEGTAPTDYAELVERFGFASPSQASNALITAKRMFQRALRAVVGEYALTDEQIEDEIRDLHDILSRCGAGRSQ